MNDITFQIVHKQLLADKKLAKKNKNLPEYRRCFSALVTLSKIHKEN